MHQLPYKRLKGLKEEYFGSFEAENENVLVVSHADTIFNFLVAVGIDIEKVFTIGFTNASVAKIEYKDDQFKLISIINKKADQFEETQI